MDSRPFIDWLSFTLPYSEDSFQYAVRRFGDFELGDSGKGGYSMGGHFLNGGSISFSPEKPSNKIWIQLSSKALFSQSVEPAPLISELLTNGAKVTRLDIAKDDYKKKINILQLYKKTASGEVCTPWKKYNLMNSGLIGDRAEARTLYIGRRESETFCRIYDKRMQAIMALNEKPEGIPLHWVRLELEVKKDRAHAIAERFDSFNLSGYIYNYLDFRDRSFRKDGEKKDLKRWKRSQFWVDFIGECEKEKLTFPRHEKGLEDTERWLNEQVSGALYLIRKTRGKVAIHEMIEGEGREKFDRNKRYKKLLDLFNAQKMRHNK